MNIDPRDPLTPEERTLAERLDRLDRRWEPSADLDAKILAAARKAVPPPIVRTPGSILDAAREPRRRRRWPAMFGLAASLVLAVGIAWQLRVPPHPAAEAIVDSQWQSPAAPPMTDAAAGESRHQYAIDEAEQSAESTAADSSPLSDIAMSNAPASESSRPRSSASANELSTTPRLSEGAVRATDFSQEKAIPVARPAPRAPAMPSTSLPSPASPPAAASSVAAEQAFESPRMRRAPTASGPPPQSPTTPTAVLPMTDEQTAETPRASANLKQYEHLQETEPHRTQASRDDSSKAEAVPPSRSPRTEEKTAAETFQQHSQPQASSMPEERANRRDRAITSNAERVSTLDGTVADMAPTPIPPPPAPAATKPETSLDMSAPVEQTVDQTSGMGFPESPDTDRDEASLTPDQWLQQIRKQRRRGDTVLAQASLRRFKEKHPETVIPEDLRALLE